MKKYSKYELVLRESRVYESAYEYKVSNSHDVKDFVVDIMGAHEYPEEHMFAISVSTKGDVIGFNEVSKGNLTSSMADPREVFKTAILQNAAAVILTHNHPSGNPQPSTEDIEVTGKLKSAGDLLGIRLLDHVIVTYDKKMISLNAEGLM